VRGPSRHDLPARDRRAATGDRSTTSNVEDVLDLQRQAGNRAVTELFSTQRDAGAHAGAQAIGRLLGATVQRWGVPTSWGVPAAVPAGRAGDPVERDAEGPTAVQPPEGGQEIDRLGVVDQEGGKSRDGRPGLNLRPAPSEKNTPVGRLDDKDHLMAKRDMGDSWMYAVVTDGHLKGSAGYVYTHNVVNFDLPPDPAAPDPGAYLYRIKPGERAHRLVRDTYGAKNIETGQDQRFFTNVLKYINDRAQRGSAFDVKTKTQRAGAMTFEVDDVELVAGKQIWIPSLELAQSLKGTVSRGSWARDVVEKIKDWGKKLASIPAFIAGLVVGAIESIKDLFVGLFELVWNAIKTLGGSLVDAAKAIWGLITEPRKRQELFEALDEELRKMLGPDVSFLRRAYNWGRIIGFATMEIVSTILLAGAANAVKVSKWGAKLAKATEAISKFPAIKKISAGAAKIADSPVGRRIVETVAPAGRAVKKVAGAVEKVTGAPQKAMFWAAKALAKKARKLGSKYGWKAERLVDAARIMEQQGARLYLRPSSRHAPARMAEGAIAKPAVIKANTLNEMDIIIGPGFSKKELGLVGHFEPTKPDLWKHPRGMRKADWDALQPALRERAAKRARSFRKLRKDMARLTKPTTTKGGEYYRVEGGLVKQVEVTDAGGEVVRSLTGDVDVLHATTLDGGKLGSKYDALDDALLEAGLTEHGIHTFWRERKDLDPDAFYGTIEAHLKEPVIEIGPDLIAREMTASEIPEIAEILASRYYRNWKRSRTGKAARTLLIGAAVVGASIEGHD